jgi:starch synthase
VVTAVGGLVDTVIDLDLDPRQGTGVVANAADPVAVMAALFRLARRITDTRRRERIQRRIMSIDWSWAEPARKYVTIYRDLVTTD